MMKTTFVLLLLCIVLQTKAQQPSGTVVYEFTRNIKMSISNSMDGRPMAAPKIPPAKVEVLFGNNQMLRRAAEDNLNELATEYGGKVQLGGMGEEDIIWLNFAEARKVQQREFANKQYLVIDSIRKQQWKLTGETKTILGYPCQQAITTRTSMRRSVNMNNGVMTQTQTPDTSQVIVWFTPSVPVSAGPDYEGQLPGLILEIAVNGKPTFTAIAISQKVDLSAIKEPKKGKPVTQKEFEAERDQLAQEMFKNLPKRPARPAN